jgi:L-threonylcarbamoyladenylate synthase
MTHPRLTSDVAEAASVLRDGGIIGFPTETVYGLAALALDRSAVERVFDVKGRPRSHPLIVHLASVENLSTWGVLDDNARILAEAFMPGPFTLLVPRTSIVPDWVTGGRDTVALRVPKHPLSHALLDSVGTAIVAPSANRFGKVSPTTADHVVSDLGDDVDLVLDGGPCEVGVESTIVECVNNEVRILRHGAVTEEMILAALPVNMSPDEGTSRAPGMLKSHYAPRARVILVQNRADAEIEIARIRESGGSAVLLWHEDMQVYAECLYSDMRQADDVGATSIVAVLPDDSGLGRAVRDRLHKAATNQSND